MGLDVNILKITPEEFNEYLQKKRNYDTDFQEVVEKVATLPPAEQMVEIEKLESKYDLTEGGYIKDPNKPFKEDGYFRSSYNQDGYNEVVDAYTNLYGFYYVFLGLTQEDSHDQYYNKIDWSSAKDRCVEILNKLNARLEERIDINIVILPPQKFAPSIPEVENYIDHYKNVKAEHKDNSSFMNILGYFLFGKDKIHNVSAILVKNDVIHLISDNSEDPTVESRLPRYIKTTERCLDVIEKILASSEPESYMIAWDS